jgi:zinc protease
VVAGEFDAAAVPGFVEDSFGSWRGPAAAKAATPAAPPAPRSEVKVITVARPGASQGEVRYGCVLPRAKDGADATRQSLLAHVVGDKLQASFRSKLGASYGVSVRAARLRDGDGYLEVSSDVENGKLAQVLTELRLGLRVLAAVAPPADALAWARYEEASHAARQETSNEGITALLLERALHGLSTDPQALRAELAAATPAGLQADLKACLASNPTLSLVGDAAVIEAAAQAWK